MDDTQTMHLLGMQVLFKMGGGGGGMSAGGVSPLPPLCISP